MGLHDLDSKRVGYTEEMEALTFSHLKNWDAGPLNYLKGERLEKRKNLKEFFPKAQAALTLLFPYKRFSPSSLVANYALGFGGEDYHHVLGRELEIIEKELKQKTPSLETLKTVDIHPVLERDLAFRCGLGFFGKNSMLINPFFGSYFMIGAIILSETDPTLKERYTKKKLEEHCGKCRRCLDSCPTKAITENKTLIVNRCISTYTIETFKASPPPKGFTPKETELFGCDRCQEVCPWNRKVLKLDLWPAMAQDFFQRPLEEIASSLEEMSNKSYKNTFKGTAFERLGKQGMLKNILRRLEK